VTLFKYLATLKRIATPSLRTAALGHFRSTQLVNICEIQILDTYTDVPNVKLFWF
jgi:hypothetical protein